MRSSGADCPGSWLRAVAWEPGRFFAITPQLSVVFLGWPLDVVVAISILDL